MMILSLHSYFEICKELSNVRQTAQTQQLEIQKELKESKIENERLAKEIKAASTSSRKSDRNQSHVQVR